MTMNTGEQTDSSPDRRSLIAMAVTIVLWASAFAGIRAGLAAYRPGHLVLLRFLTASVVLGVYAAATRMPLPRPRDVPAVLVLGFLGITVYHTALTYGEQTVTAGAASLLIAAAPIFTALLARVFLRERIGVRGWLGIAVSFGGIFLIALGEGGGLHLNQQAFLILLAAAATSLYFVFQKPFLRRYEPLQFTAYILWGGTLFMLAFLPGFCRVVATAPRDATIAVVYMGLFPGAVAYVTWTYAQSRMQASTATCFLYLTPVTAILIAWLWLRELPSGLSLLGGLLALAGVVVVNTRRRK